MTVFDMSESGLSASRLRRLVKYDPATGIFIRRVTSSCQAKRGDIAGSVHRGSGRKFFYVDGKRYAAHRLAWLYVHGSWPAHVIDHINGDAGDNRIANLRDVEQSTNMENQHEARTDSESGVLGVGWCKHHRKWKARIRVHGRFKHLKYCGTKEEAAEAYLLAKRNLHGGCTI